ncbi:MAG: tail fiber domain-containing protein [Verrucomicrobia bacterium]|nr:tail fiber domain-containing protein [Verrucomicrobiota bacterium]
MKLPLLAALLALLSTLTPQLSAASLGTAFTYQGRLTDATGPANGLYEIQFSLYDAVTNGTLVGTPVNVAPVPVSNGVFGVTLDFGANPFTGAARWLEITLSVYGSDMIPITLSPRQPVTPAPYALHAASAAGVMSFLDAPLEFRVRGERPLRIEPTPPNGLYALGAPNLIGGSESNTVAANIAGATIAGGGVAHDEDGGTYPNVVTGDFGTVGGGFGNTSGGWWGARWATVAGGSLNCSANEYATVGGGSGNTNLGWSATVAGGYRNDSRGDHDTVSGGLFNFSDGGSTGGATVSGGRCNTNSGTEATIAGGAFNVCSSVGATVSGGLNNVSSDWFATVAGGAGNLSLGQGATVGGGAQNTNVPSYGTVGGGQGNLIGSSASYGAIVGGHDNAVGLDADYAFVGGGLRNTIGAYALGATVSGGEANAVGLNAGYATVGGGQGNTNASMFASIGGGGGNAIGGDSSYSTVAGGEQNTIAREALNSTIGGGETNRIETQSDGATISGGAYNVIGAAADNAAIGGGLYNEITGKNSTVAGGENNAVESASHATIAGGHNNWIKSNGATIAGGDKNFSDEEGFWASIGGGQSNSVRDSFATVPGGRLNVAGGAGSFAAGTRAEAMHDGSFVWADGSHPALLLTIQPFRSETANEFAVRAVGGARFVTAIDNTGAPTAGVTLSAGGGAWATLSDRNAKENIAPVNGRAVLEKLLALPVATWNYRSQKEAVRHIGPMAQDFHAAFSVGEDDRHITTSDADGVALAAIKGLHEIVREKDAEIQALKQRLEKLEQLLNRSAAK